MNLVFQYSPYFILLCLLLSAGISFLFYRFDRKLGDLPLWQKIGLGFLRFVVLTVLFVFLLEPYFKTIFTEVKKPIIAVGIDKSESIAQKTDSTRLFEITNQLKALEGELSEKFELRYLEFGDKVSPLSEAGFTQKTTDFSAFFKEVEDRFGSQNYAGSILLSDGLLNKGRSVSNLSSNLKAPVYVIGVGDTTKRKDALIKAVRANKFAYLGNQFEIEVDIKAVLAQNQLLQVGLISNGNTLADTLIDVKSADFLSTLRFRVEADSIGVQSYTLRIKALEDEENLSNNTQTVFIEVLDARQKILILSEYPHPDVGAIKSALDKNPNYEVQASVYSKFKGNLGTYNLLILHQLPSANQQVSTVIMEASNAKIPVWQVFTPSTNAGLANKMHPGFTAVIRRGSNNGINPSINEGFGLFSLSDKTKIYLSEVPPLTVPFGEFSVAEVNKALLFQKIGNVSTKQPMLSFHEEQAIKTAVFVGEGLWRWRMRDFQLNETHAHFDELISKVVQYLAIKEERKRFTVEAERSFTENENIVFEARLYDASFTETTEPTVSLAITDDDGSNFDYSFTPLSRFYRLDAGSFSPGKYNYVARTKIGTESFEERGFFTVSALQIELVNTTADFDALSYLASETGGKFYASNQLENLQNDLKELNAKSISYSRKKLENVLNLRWLFFALLAFLALEWFVRKRAGTY